MQEWDTDVFHADTKWLGFVGKSVFVGQGT